MSFCEPVLPDQKLCIDFADHTVNFIDRIDSDAGVAIPLFWRRNDFCGGVLLDIEDWGPQLFVIDTGLVGYGSLSTNLFRKLASNRKLAVVGQWEGETIWRSEKRRIGKIASADLGQIHFPGCLFDENTECLLGIDFFEDFVLTFDFPANRVYMRRGKEPASRSTLITNGLLISPSKNGAVVEVLLKVRPLRVDSQTVTRSWK